jgi:hypothetical protein
MKAVSSVLSVSTMVALFVTPALAQMTGAPAPGFKREVGQPASAIPAPLREIGFDQNIGDLVPLDAPSATKPARRCGLATISAAARS